jgi:hypothetical protein
MLHETRLHKKFITTEKTCDTLGIASQLTKLLFFNKFKTVRKENTDTDTVEIIFSLYI